MHTAQLEIFGTILKNLSSNTEVLEAKTLSITLKRQSGGLIREFNYFDNDTICPRAIPPSFGGILLEI